MKGTNTIPVIFPNTSKPAEVELVQGGTVDLNAELTTGQILGFCDTANDFHDEEGDIYYPDHESLIANYIATKKEIYTIPIAENSKFLILEWLPMDGLSDESYLRINLNGDDNYSLYL